MSEYTSTVFRSTSKIPTSSWNHLLEHSNFATVYHSLPWLNTIEEVFDVNPRHIIVKKDGSPVAALPNYISSLDGTPFYALQSLSHGNAGPILSGDWEQGLGLLLDTAEQIGEKRDIVAHRIRSDVQPHLQLNKHLSEEDYNLTLRGKLVLNLKQSWENIYQNMSKDRRYNLRKAKEQDYQIEQINPKKALHPFYTKYEEMINDMQGSLRPKKFFDILFNKLGDNLLMTEAIIDSESRGYHLYIIDKYQAKVRHSFSAVISEDYDYYPGELMHEFGIRWGIKNGYKTYDFGGSSIDFRDGLFNYKSQYGGDIKPIFIWERQYSYLGWNYFRLKRYLYRRFKK